MRNNLPAKSIVKTNKDLLKNLEKEFKEKREFTDPSLQKINLDSQKQRKLSIHSNLSRKSQKSTIQKQQDKAKQQNLQLKNYQEKDDTEGPLTQLSIKEYKNFKNKRSSIMEGFTAHQINNIVEYMDEYLLADEENSRFKDEDFLPELRSIASDSKQLSDDAFQTFGDIQFIGVEYIVEEAHNMQFSGFKENQDFYLEQIVKGKLNNQSFLNALALTVSNKKLFQYLCCMDDQDVESELDQEQTEKIKNKQAYFFRFYKNKFQKYTVLVDSYLPVVQLPNKKYVNVFSRQDNENEFWVPLIEKAYAKLNGSYERIEKIDLRTAINDFTGLEPEILHFSSKEHIHIQNLQKLLIMYQKNQNNIIGFMRTSNINDQKKYKTKLNRVYIFCNYDNDNQKLTFKNPWYNAPQIDNESDQNSEITIDFDTFFELFNCLIIIKDFPEEYRGTQFEIQLEPSFGMPSAQNQKFMQNQQILFDIKDSKQDTNIEIFCKQINGIQATRHCTVGLVLLKVGEGDLRAKAMNYQSLKMSHKSDKFQGRFTAGYSYLQKGSYAIIPFSNIKQEKGGVYLNLEIYYDCAQKDIKFYEKQGKELILEDAKNDISETIRIFTDKVKKSDALKYQLRPIPQINNKEFNQDYISLLPCNLKDFLIINQNALLLSLEKNQEMGQKLQENSEKNQDPLLQNFQEAQLINVLLGQEDEEDIQQNQTNPPTQDIIDFVDQETQGVYDFNYYGLGDKGLQVLLPILIAENNILEVNLSGNNLGDESINQLCYELEKSHHLELEALDLSDNKIGELGAKTLITFVQRMKNLVSLNLEENTDIPEILLEKIKTYLIKRENELEGIE